MLGLLSGGLIKKGFLSKFPTPQETYKQEKSFIKIIVLINQL